MKATFRHSMSWLHTWVGLLLGWLLYFVFITGTAGYLDTEIDRWMMPEAPIADFSVAPEKTLELSIRYLEQHAPDAQRWFSSLPINRNDPYPRVFWSGAQGEGVAARGSQLLDPTTGAALETRDTSGGQTLYRMHWRLHYLPAEMAFWLVGVATMFMLIALITGVIIHRKIFADFFSFRPKKGPRSWLDAHNITSVLSLPFQLMITYSGLIFMMFTYMPLVVAAWYGTGAESRQQFFDEVFSPLPAQQASTETASMVALEQIVHQAQLHWQGAALRSIDIQHPYNANSRIIVRGNHASGPLRAAGTLVFDGVSGELLTEQPARISGSKTFRDLMLGLHEGLFAGPVLRALYVFFGLLGSAMIATGLMLWSVKRRERAEKSRQQPHFGLRLVEKLNVATVLGLPVAIAAYFWANRLLPLELSNRAGWEVHCLFLVWLLLLIHASLRSTRQVWLEQSWLAAAAFGCLPLLNALTTDRDLLTSLAAGDWVFAGFDLSMLGLGVLFACLAGYLQSKAVPSTSTASTRPAARPSKAWPEAK